MFQFTEKAGCSRPSDGMLHMFKLNNAPVAAICMIYIQHVSINCSYMTEAALRLLVNTNSNGIHLCKEINRCKSDHCPGDTKDTSIMG